MTSAAPPPSPQQIPATWDAVAPTYAADISQWADYAEEALRSLPVGPGDRVLDVATGPGTLAFAAAKRAREVAAIDFSPGMIAELEARAARERVENVSAAVMDAQALAFPDASFDAAFCLFGCFFFPDRPRAFSELRRVLRPDGRALIATWAPIDRRPIMKLAFDAMAEALPHLPRPAKGDLQSPEECVRELSEAGFHEVATHAFTASMHFESAARYLEVIVRSAAPFALMKKKLDEAAWNATMSRMLDALSPRFPAGGLELSAEALLTTCRR